MKLTSLNNLPEQGVSHNPEIKKKVIIQKGEIPQLMNFSSATFTPGQSVETHAHNTMFEVYHIQKGKALFTVEGKELILNVGDTITIEPGEQHAQANPFDEDTTWLYFGIATD
ncbi:cupin domain-containing protein [Patescibacteria group bacterium]|nr:cupin domain-containing protein [Patescibacteria group bacterium]MBU1721368.1 cupin domain-containing protein [Patescibacteria group bacterium]